MARPRTIKGSGPSVPTGPFRVSPEQRAALETWARRRGLLDKAGEPELGAAFRDLLDLALAVSRADEKLCGEGYGADRGVERLLAELAGQFSPLALGRDALEALRRSIEPRPPASHVAASVEPTTETKSP